MTQTLFRHPERQRGVTMFGLLFWGVLIAFTAVLVAQVLPTVMEYFTIQRAVKQVIAKSPSTVGAARDEFTRIKQVEYSIGIESSDLDVTKENEKLRIGFAYTREVHVGGPVYVLLKYDWQSN
jgi:Domain of unknown function (DUF4845)